MKKPLSHRRRSILALLFLFFTSCAAPTLEPTVTPTSQPGFQRFEGESFDIRLPESFATEARRDLFLEEGENVTASDGFTNLSINRDNDEDYLGQTLGDVTEEAMAALGRTPGLVLVDRFDFLAPDAEMARLIARADETVTGLDQTIVIVQYIIKDGATLWVISFGTRESSLEEWLELFDTSAQSFSFN